MPKDSAENILYREFPREMKCIFLHTWRKYFVVDFFCVLFSFLFFFSPLLLSPPIGIISIRTRLPPSPSSHSCLGDFGVLLAVGIILLLLAKSPTTNNFTLILFSTLFSISPARSIPPSLSSIWLLGLTRLWLDCVQIRISERSERTSSSSRM